MNISPIFASRVNYIRFGLKNPKTKQTKNDYSFSFCSTSIQMQEVEFNQKKEKEFFDNFLVRKGQVTREEYEDIIKNHPSVLIKAENLCDRVYSGYMTPKKTAAIVLKINKALKKIYPDTRIISIGTSPSPVTEQLQYLGHDIVFVPISGFRPYEKKLHTFENEPDLKILANYLNTKNIDNDKHNIVLDYTYSGYTLEKIQNFIQEYCGISDKNIEAVSINKLLIHPAISNRTRKNWIELKTEILEDMKSSKIEEISNIPHFPVLKRAKKVYSTVPSVVTTENKSEEEIFKELDNYSKPLARAFALCTMHEINKSKGKK